jgi:hypothetical protein
MAKICFYTSFVFNHGGEQRVTVVIANELAKKHQVIIYSQDEESDYRKNPYHLSEDIEVRKIEQPAFGTLNRIARRAVREINERTSLFYNKDSFLPLLEYAYFQKKWQAYVLEELNKETYDAVIAVSGGNTIKIGMIADRLPCKVIGWEHNTFEAYFRSRNYYFYHQDALFKESIRRMDECVVLNDNIKEKYFAAFDKVCKVFYNPRSFVSEEKSPLTEKTFVTCGRIIKQKGYDLLIDSFYQFSLQNKEWNLILVGDGEERVSLEQKIREYGLESRIRITGYQSDVKPYLLHASCYLMPSRWEGFPMVLTEAFEMGLPAIAYDIIAVEPLLTHGEEGLIAASFDTADYAKQMLAMADMTDEKRRAMAEKAIRKADTLAIEQIVEKWENLIA